MYTPRYFRVDDPRLIQDFIRDNNFGILLSSDASGLIHDTHTPFLISEEGATLSGHLARANEQWKSWTNPQPVRVIFHGPHCYISPSFYQSEFNVPTWNYTAVSITGNLSLIQEPSEQMQLLQDLSEFQEAGFPRPWSIDDSDSRYQKMLAALIFFHIEITQIEAKYKLNQNKSEEDQLSVVRHLLQSPSPSDQDVGRLMQQHLKL